MIFYDFQKMMNEFGVFSIHQVSSWNENFDTNNLTRWAKKGYIVKLRNGFYTFPEYQNTAGFNLYIANRIYKPSYISLHYALNFYGLIPEVITTLTSISTLKTCKFQNDFGTFSYQSITRDLFFGYNEMPFNDRTVLFASLEKAILDLFYLYEFYDNEKEIELLRFDETIIESINKDVLFGYLYRFKNKALEKRINLMFGVYQL